LQVS
jgi:hypothetical protein